MKYLLNGEQSERLLFRLVQEGDFDIWLQFFDNPDVARFLGMDCNKSQRELCETWFTFLSNRYNNDLGGMNALIDKQTGEFIGQCGLLVETIDDKTELEIGYSIMPRHRGKAYAAEAAAKCRDFAFENKFADYLIAIIHPENIISAKVADKIGMKFWKNTLYNGVKENIYKIDNCLQIRIGQ